MLDRSPAETAINDHTSLKVTQNGSQVSLEFGAFGGASAATIFKGKIGNNRLAAVWWYGGYDHETKVLWGEVHGDRIRGRMIYPRVADRQGLVPGWVEIAFDATKKKVLKPVGGAVIKPGRGMKPVKPRRPAIKEDCLDFNTRDVTLKKESNGYLLTDGRSRMKVFPNREEARKALRTIRHYRLDSHCFVGRPQPSMEYWLADGQAPDGAMPNEDCIAFDPAKLRLQKEGSNWLMTDGRSRMRIFPNKSEAQQALRIIQEYGFNRTCYIGRPDPSMTYFRK